jgi:hypothetical protein
MGSVWWIGVRAGAWVCTRIWQGHAWIGQWELDWSVGTREDTAHAKVKMCAHLAKWSQLLNVDKLLIHVAQRKVPVRHLLEQLLVVVETCHRRVRARKCERVRA